MKIWYGYGSEHSMNLVMVGSFKSSDDAKKVDQLIQKLTDELRGKIEAGVHYTRYKDEVLELLNELKVHTLGPNELEQFLYDARTNVERDKLILTTEESEISSFLKLMINNGAKVEIYSAHDYPDSEYGR